MSLLLTPYIHHTHRYAHTRTHTHTYTYAHTSHTHAHTRSLLFIFVLILCTVAPMVMLVGVTVNKTESADLTCTVTGTPRPNIKWYMLTDSSNDTVEVIENTRYTIVEAVSTGGDKNMQVVSVLTISNTKIDDTGVYTCDATNVQGSDTVGVMLTVQCTSLCTVVCMVVCVCVRAHCTLLPLHRCSSHH